MSSFSYHTALLKSRFAFFTYPFILIQHKIGQGEKSITNTGISFPLPGCQRLNVFRVFTVLYMTGGHYLSIQGFLSKFFLSRHRQRHVHKRRRKHKLNSDSLQHFCSHIPDNVPVLRQKVVTVSYQYTGRNWAAFLTPLLR